jgi:hypothetical protein
MTLKGWRAATTLERTRMRAPLSATMVLPQSCRDHRRPRRVPAAVSGSRAGPSCSSRSAAGVETTGGGRQGCATENAAGSCVAKWNGVKRVCLSKCCHDDGDCDDDGCCDAAIRHQSPQESYPVQEGRARLNDGGDVARAAPAEKCHSVRAKGESGSSRSSPQRLLRRPRMLQRPTHCRKMMHGPQRRCYPPSRPAPWGTGWGCDARSNWRLIATVLQLQRCSDCWNKEKSAAKAWVRRGCRGPKGFRSRGRRSTATSPPRGPVRGSSAPATAATMTKMTEACWSMPRNSCCYCRR